MAVDLQSALPRLLENLPKEWRGTTFRNSDLLGREVFSQRLLSLVAEKGTALSAADLEAVGNAEVSARASIAPPISDSSISFWTAKVPSTGTGIRWPMRRDREQWN